MPNQTTPFISVIIPLYNKEKFVKRSLDSVLSQSYDNFEVLVVNDGSTDGSREVVFAVDDPRIRLIDQPNGGVSSARNRGIDEARGVYVAFLDADDMWYEKHLEILIEGIETYPDAVMLANALEYRWRESQEINHIRSAGRWQEEDYLYSLSRGKFPIHIGSSMFKRDLLHSRQIRFYEHMRLAEDVNFMLRVSRFGRSMRSDYIGLVYYQDDVHSAMKQKHVTASPVPAYFEGMADEPWSPEERGQIKKFLFREYMKKAYQNRGVHFQKEELHIVTSGGNVSVWRWSIVPYMMIRFMPEWVFAVYRKLKR